MFQAMFSSISSIKAHQVRMNVVGNNIANVNTTAYKSGRVSFQDMLAQTLRGSTKPSTGGIGGTDPMQVGLGVLVGSVDTNMEQGSLQATNRVTDLAVQGNGYFVVSNGKRIAYTRDGNFDLDASGVLVQKATGEKLIGWAADATGVIDPTQPLNANSVVTVPIGQMMAGRSTSRVEFKGNLDSQADVSETWTTSVTVYDAMGAPHDIRLTLSNHLTPPPTVPAPPAGAVSSWEWSAWEGNHPVGSSGTTGNTLIYFDANGRVTGQATQSITVTPTNGAEPFVITLDFNRVTQLASWSTLEPSQQDGYAAGTLQQLTISPDGVISGVFSNGLNRAIGRIALAIFSNPAGLERLGNNLLRESNNSGIANIGMAETGGRGSVSSGYLEMSNVDLGAEFTNLVVTQRGFQANTRMVSTVDEMMQDLLQMKR